MISTDRGLLNPDSGVSTRMRAYGELFDTLDVIVFVRGVHQEVALSERVRVYPTNSTFRIGYIFDAIRIAQARTFSVVSAQDPFETGFVARCIATKRRCPLHLQVHTDVFATAFKQHSVLNRLRVRCARWLLPQAQGIRVVSERIAASIRAQVPECTVTPVVLPIAVNPCTASPRVFPYAQTILMVSRLESEKHIHRAIDAFARIARTHPDAGLVIAGDGRLRAAFEKQVCSHGIGNQVQFLGTVADVCPLYAGADIFMQLSAYEGYGMTLVEAALAGVPILTTDVGVVGELLIDGGSCLVTSGVTSDIVQKLEQLLDNEPLRLVLAGRAQEAARAHVRSSIEYLEAYKEAFTCTEL
ncbi:MAG: hypothetical protein RL150_484 [Candidatus Parcubacteria bacterium]